MNRTDFWGCGSAGRASPSQGGGRRFESDQLHIQTYLIVEIANAIYDKGARITLTSNGALLENRMGIGRYIEKANISLHTVSAETYKRIVGVNSQLSRVITALRQFCKE